MPCARAFRSRASLRRIASAGRWLVDGSVLNPVPFDVARERFGGPVVAVAVHAAVRHRARRHPPPSRQLPLASGNSCGNPGWRAGGTQDWLEAQLENYPRRRQGIAVDSAPGAGSGHGDHPGGDGAPARRHEPADLMLEPDVSRIGVLEFYRGKEAIAAGHAAARKKWRRSGICLRREATHRMHRVTLWADLVPRVGIEPTRCRHHQILSLARLPVPPPRLDARQYNNLAIIPTM